MLKSIYFSLIRSHINVGILYKGKPKSNLKKILKTQKQAIRLILNPRQRESVNNAFSQLQIPTISAV